MDGPSVLDFNLIFQIFIITLVWRPQLLTFLLFTFLQESSEHLNASRSHSKDQVGRFSVNGYNMPYKR